ncbi:MAG: hypothetical protein WC055_00585 [Melioribacteraceae bacterium]
MNKIKESTKFFFLSLWGGTKIILIVAGLSFWLGFGFYLGFKTAYKYDIDLYHSPMVFSVITFDGDKSE